MLNASSFKSLAVFAAALLAAGVATAQSQPEAAMPEVSRAEVLAEIVIWRESGLADAQSGDTAGDPTSPEHIAALARYEAMRASPRFAQLVQRIARERGERQVVAASRG